MGPALHKLTGSILGLAMRDLGSSGAPPSLPPLPRAGGVAAAPGKRQQRHPQAGDAEEVALGRVIARMALPFCHGTIQLPCAIFLHVTK